jgi:hypothetical protein
MTWFSRKLRSRLTDTLRWIFGFLHPMHRCVFPAAWNSVPHLEQYFTTVSAAFCCTSPGDPLS